jgi:hypothetical protein
MLQSCNTLVSCSRLQCRMKEGYVLRGTLYTPLPAVPADKCDSHICTTSRTAGFTMTVYQQKPDAGSSFLYNNRSVCTSNNYGRGRLYCMKSTSCRGNATMVPASGTSYPTPLLVEEVDNFYNMQSVMVN